jgi:hypothetical protein
MQRKIMHILDIIEINIKRAVIKQTRRSALFILPIYPDKQMM